MRRREEGLEHECPAGAGLAPFLALSGRIPGDPHRTPVTTRLNGLGLVAGRAPALLMLKGRLSRFDRGRQGVFTCVGGGWQRVLLPQRHPGPDS
jgi:hypothetical protein